MKNYCDCKHKKTPETRKQDGQNSFFGKSKKDGTHEPITAEEFKQKVQGKVAARAESVDSCDSALETIPGQPPLYASKLTQF